jgi:hypothetical protein
MTRVARLVLARLGMAVALEAQVPPAGPQKVTAIRAGRLIAGSGGSSRF